MGNLFDKKLYTGFIACALLAVFFVGTCDVVEAVEQPLDTEVHEVVPTDSEFCDCEPRSELANKAATITTSKVKSFDQLSVDIDDVTTSVFFEVTPQLVPQYFAPPDIAYVHVDSASWPVPLARSHL